MKNKLMMMLMATAFVPMLAISAHAADVVVDDGAFIPSAENGDAANSEFPTYGDDALETPVLVVDDGAFIPSDGNGDTADVDTDIPDGGLHVVDGLDVADAGGATDGAADAGDAGDVPTVDDANIDQVCCSNPDDLGDKVDGGEVGSDGPDVHIMTEFPMNNGGEAVEKEMMETMVPMNDSVGATEAPEVNDAAAQVEVPEIRQPSTEKYNN